MPSEVPAPMTSSLAGCRKCDKRCVICSTHLQETATYRSGTEFFPIRDSLSCSKDNVIYRLFCEHCPDRQYVGQTQNPLITWLHRNHLRTNIGSHLTQHFHSPNHKLNNLKCMCVETVCNSSLSAQLKHETFWIQTLKTL